MQPAARIIFSIALILISGLACLLLARYLTRPISRFRTTGQRIAGGDLAARVGAGIGDRNDEFGALARDFDRMAERVEALLESQQRLMRDVSHELRSPLARLQAAVGLIRQKGGDEKNRNLDRVEREAENLNALIGEILQYSRLQGRSAVSRESTDLTGLVQHVVDDANFEGQARGREVIFEGSESITLEIDANLVHSAVENVVRNALQHSVARTTVTVKALPGPPARACVKIFDDGPGVAPEDLGRIFEPFVSAQPDGARAGAGIGLAIARRAIELHGGSVAARNDDRGGLAVDICLPLE